MIKANVNKNHNDLSRNKISTFNSKLFFDIELSDKYINSNSDTEDSDISTESPSIELKDYLSNDLIEVLELPPYNQDINNSNNSNNGKKDEQKFPIKNSKNEKNGLKKDYNHELNNQKNINIFYILNYNPLLPLVNKGYQFTPKNMTSNNFEKKNNCNIYCKDQNILNYLKKNECLFKINKVNKTNKKNDWYCSFCNNLNYSFRVKCNRCNSSRESSDNAYKKCAKNQAQNNCLKNMNNNNNN